MENLIPFLIVCPLVFLAGFVDAVAGGGGLISLPAYLIFGVPVHMAIGTNKLSSAMGTALTTWRFGRQGLIPWKQALFCVICALCGSAIGANLALLLTGAAHMGLVSANGIAKAINLSTNMAALTVFVLSGKVLFLLGTVAGCFSLAGNYLGSKLFLDKGANSVKPLVIVVLTIFFCKVLGELL